jgi:ABC-type glutathione transport system ATPase component
MIDLSRDDGVTIFLSTHFMNEAERCDRISLMHAGKVLAFGAPLDLVKERGSDSLEDTFVGYLADAAGIDRTKKVESPPPAAMPSEAEPIRPPRRFDLARLWAYATQIVVEVPSGFGRDLLRGARPEVDAAMTFRGEPPRRSSANEPRLCNRCQATSTTLLITTVVAAVVAALVAMVAIAIAIGSPVLSARVSIVVVNLM